MIAILAEDKSDAETLVIIVRRLAGNPRLSVHHKGFSGCGELRRKAKSHIDLFASRGADRFIICHDSDNNDANDIRTKILNDIVAPAGIVASACIIVPVQEIEAWIIADETAIKRVIPSFNLKTVSQPEQISSPKEWLLDQSRVKTARPLYSHATHNPRVAEHLDLAKVSVKCPSFRPLVAFMNN